MRQRLLPLALAAVCLAPQSLSAHPSLQAREATVGASYKAVISIPHGCDGSPTVKVRVQIPEGVIGVKPMPKPGWTVSTVRGPYARSYPYYHGQALAEGVKEIVWSGNLADDYFDEFVFSGFLADSLPAGTTLYFPTFQDCEKGGYRWIEVPAPGQSAHALAAPAPGLMLRPAQKTAAAKTYKIAALVIEAPWARATPAGASVAGAYLKITNTGEQSDRLIGGSMPNAADVEVHEMTMTDGVMKMRRLQTGLEIKPGQSVELKPGGYHLMVVGLKEALKDGQTVKGTLVFEKAGTIEVEYGVAPIGAPSGGHAHH